MKCLVDRGSPHRGVNAIVQYLVEKGANLEARDEHGWSPLAIARGLTCEDWNDRFRGGTAHVFHYEVTAQIGQGGMGWKIYPTPL
jgi:hypothetical protein